MKGHKALFSSASVEWATPQAVYDQLNAEFHFDLDPCPLNGSQDGLARLFTEWRGKRVFVNPPYTRAGFRQWLERGREADLAVFLIPARTDTSWFHDLVLPYASEIRFIQGRLKFGNATSPAPFPSMIVVFRK
jgi:site-specific DNA-methyltransferase (adenine-specific)